MVGPWPSPTRAGCSPRIVSGARVGTSFLQLAEAIGARRGDLDPVAIVEFLDLGKVYEGRTLLPEIRRLRPGTVYELREAISR